jgi:hypothetical protein
MTIGKEDPMTKAMTERRQETDRVASEIIKAQSAARDAKTARLREARRALQKSLESRMTAAR